MPRDLGDVLHYFLPEADPASGASSLGLQSSPARALERPAALPIVALPIGERDVMRAAFAWNLAVEIARNGASATLLAPRDAGSAPLWPEPGRGPVGAEVQQVRAESPGALARAALDVAVTRAADADEGGLVLVRVPPAWLRGTSDARALLRWSLLFASSDPRDLRETYAQTKQLLSGDPERRVGVTIHGVTRVDEAQRAFERIAGACVKHLNYTLVSYGLLVDDLHVYRAIVARRPIGLEHPQSRAARAMRDVAALLLEDARRAIDG